MLAGMDLIGQLSTVCIAFCTASGLTLEQLSARIFTDQRRLARVFAHDAGLTVQSLEKAVAWLDANWPDDAEWPEDGLPRPVRANSNVPPAAIGDEAAA